MLWATHCSFCQMSSLIMIEALSFAIEAHPASGCSQPERKLPLHELWWQKNSNHVGIKCSPSHLQWQMKRTFRPISFSKLSQLMLFPLCLNVQTLTFRFIQNYIRTKTRDKENSNFHLAKQSYTEEAKVCPTMHDTNHLAAVVRSRSPRHLDSLVSDSRWDKIHSWYLGLSTRITTDRGLCAGSFLEEVKQSVLLHFWHRRATKDPQRPVRHRMSLTKWKENLNKRQVIQAIVTKTTVPDLNHTIIGFPLSQRFAQSRWSGINISHRKRITGPKAEETLSVWMPALKCFLQPDFWNAKRL